MGLLMIAAGVVLARHLLARQAHAAAARHLAAGAIGAAEQSLDWIESWRLADQRTHLLRAACCRRLGEREQWQRALEAAAGGDGSSAGLRQERELGNYRWGQIEHIVSGDFQALVKRGASPQDAAAAVINGLLAQNQLAAALQLSEDWAADSPDEAEPSFLRGICRWSAGNRLAAMTEFEMALTRQPLHELARASLARVLEEEHRLSEALAHYGPLLEAAPERESLRVDAARVLRKLGRTGQARAVLRPPDPGVAPAQRVALELAEIEYESGHYDQARQWFEASDLEGQHLAETLRSAASNFALQGDLAKADELFARVDDAQGVSRMASELRRRLAIDPGDAEAAAELQRLSQTGLMAEAATPTTDSSAPQLSPLFVQYCASCHGESGRGDGRAARHLFPRPRDLRCDKYRLVSRLDCRPAREDIERVIEHGMPGSSMPAFGQLTEQQRQQLTGEVYELARVKLIASESAAGAADALLSVPTIPAASPESIERGRAVYLRCGCQQCHGPDGKPATAPTLLDEEGRPTIPRDLVSDPMKGGAGGPSLYRRIRLGMPGTPHPASPSLSEEETIALVHFCQSLAKEPMRQSTNHEREVQAARR